MVLQAAVAAVLLLRTVASAQPGAGYVVEEGTLARGGYRLTNASPAAGGTINGGGYRLVSVVASAAAGNGCCCIYLPCILRDG